MKTHKFHWSRLVGCICLAAGMGFAASTGLADEDRYASENKAQEVRPPVLDQPWKFDGPKRVDISEIRRLSVCQAQDVDHLLGMVAKDALVTGKVESIFIPKGRNKVILNFGADFRNCFKVVIDVRDFEKWGTKDAETIGKLFEGRETAVDGLVSLHQKNPQIVVTLPHQLRLVQQP